MRVYQVINSYKGGGAESLVEELKLGLIKRGVLCNAVVFSERALHNNDFFDIEANNGDECLSTSPRSIKALFRLRKFMKKAESEHGHVIYHAHLTWPLYYLALASIGIDCKLVFTEHNTNNKRRRLHFLKFFERFVYGRYDRIICISKGVRKSLEKWLGDGFNGNFITVYNGARLLDKNRSISHLNIQYKEYKFISVGSLTTQKGLDIVIKALAYLPAEINWSYAILGDGPERSRLESLAEKYGIRDRINFVGWSNQVSEYYYSSDIQLIPSVWEGFGLVAVEGMSAGLSIVASRVDGLKEVLGDSIESVFYVRRQSDTQEWVERIAESVNSLSRNAKILREASICRSQLFSLDRMVDNYLNLYNKIDESNN
ncbi:glycosyltransferase family 4 protein [Idiomarina aminovorans]|uniref:glycosyltransferase family 4 protein n=1 Tax=Idiomarina aminovorans TaxID=2914829 RepID=UPI0020035011|nr:glycosyltransferase family 4 protein [Idiomarina sp. ATCH4]MCK7459138.1 glycosyltransferase family 4 protein [Idiomarina sp. ATCH4]